MLLTILLLAVLAVALFAWLSWRALSYLARLRSRTNQQIYDASMAMQPGTKHYRANPEYDPRLDTYGRS
jgi:HAMP domain-containing protein